MKNLLIVFALIAICSSCTDDFDENQLDSLVGIWANTKIVDDKTLSQSLQYNFDSNKTFIVSRVIVENATSEIMGYRFRALGTFEVNGNMLILNKSEIYNHDDSNGLFSDINNLELSNGDAQETVTFSFDESESLLTFVYGPCGPAENCPSSQIFERIE